MLRVQPGEGRTVALVVTLMFVTVAGQTIGESGVGALFFDRVGTSALPLMYLLQGATGLAARGARRWTSCGCYEGCSSGRVRSGCGLPDSRP